MVRVVVVQVVAPTGVLVIVVVLCKSKMILGLVCKTFGDQLAELFLVV